MSLSALSSAPKNSWVPSYVLASLVGLVIASASFASYRNHSFRDREQARAVRAAQQLADQGTTTIATDASGVVSPPRAVSGFPFLQQRRLRSGRVLGGANPQTCDKLLYDAASDVEKRGAIVRFLADDSGRVLAAVPTADHDAVAVVVTRATKNPEGFPFLVVLGLLAIGALVAAAGASVGNAARTMGLALGASGLAVPAYLWCGVGTAALVCGFALATAIADRRGWLSRTAAELRQQRVAYTFLAPAGLAMVILVATPFLIGLVLGFYDHNHGQWTYVGLRNFAEIISGHGRALNDPLNFWFTLGVTVLWTGVNVLLHVTLGVCLALQLCRPGLWGRGWFRMLLILPWAIPNYITALIWHGMFQGEYGAVNALLSFMGLANVSWFSNWASAFIANVTTNTWLGFPFMMVIALGALETIPRDMYEAAAVDGASSWQRFAQVTLPHLRPAMVPAMVLGAIWTFNMFNVIYLVSAGRPGYSTDILVTEAYKWAFERGERYGLASAYATIIFLILLMWTQISRRMAVAKDERL